MSGGAADQVESAPQGTLQELEALRAGSSARWLAWQGYLRGVALGRYRLPADVADDVVQEALLALHRSLDQIREPRSLRAFMLQTLCRKVYDQSRPASARGQDPLDGTASPGALPHASTLRAPGRSPEEAYAWAERRGMVREELTRICAIRRHGDRDLKIVTGVLLDGTKCGEIAVEMGLNPQTVYNVLHRVLKALKGLGVHDDL